METRAVAKFVRISPQKMRIIIKEVRGKTLEEAIAILSFMPKKGAKILADLIKSAAANASQNLGLDIDTLKLKKVYADEGPMLKRWRPRAQGRATRIRKRTSHITVIVDEI